MLENSRKFKNSPNLLRPLVKFRKFSDFYKKINTKNYTDRNKLNFSKF